MPKTEDGAGGAGAPFQLPADLSTLTSEALGELLASANAELDGILDAGKRAEDLPRASQLAKAIKSINARSAEIDQEVAKTEADFQALIDDIRPAAEADIALDGQADVPAPVDGEVVEGEVVDAPAPQLITASGRPSGGAQTASRDTGGLRGGEHRLNPSLSGARAGAPQAMVRPTSAPLAITASVGLPGAFEAGARIDSMGSLGELAERRARNMSPARAGAASNRRREEPYNKMVAGGENGFEVDRSNWHDDQGRPQDEAYGGVQIASISNSDMFGDNVFGRDTKRDVIDAYMEKVMGAGNSAGSGKFESLVAAGGWCAPAQIRYDFFNIAAECGMIDLPTFGVERGGISFPVSPSLADTFSPALPWYTAFSNATVPWLWTNQDDILAVTGSPTKPCIRVPCSTMSTSTLECYGICLTAGNLADNAWPESTRNFLRLLMSAHYHASNARYISTIVGLATAVASCSVTGAGAAAPLLATAELGAIDTRAKFGMCGDAVIEQVYPEWSLGLVRADLAKRTGVAPNDSFNIPNSEIMRWFDVRNIRAQFVQDYQVRAAGQPGAATPITGYPTAVSFLNYAAGTVARGNGMSLDLGVVRDSTLNAKNDFTAAWMEDCHLIARFGHEVRQYTVNTCADGTTGAADLTACCP
jgi:hypothetical protein